MTAVMQLPTLGALRSWWAETWRGDALASDLPMQGEHRVARSRTLLVAVLTVVGLAVLAGDPGNVGYRRALPVNLACLALSVAVLRATRRGTRPRGLAIVTCIADVTLVSLLHVAELAQHTPSVAVNGRITFAGYFFAMLGTCVRWDPRLPLIAGATAALQYAGIAWWGHLTWPAAATPDVLAFGTFDWGVQLERVVTLALFGVGCRSIARWTVQLRASATHDALTGVLNRRTFEERLHNELLLARREGRTTSVAFLDLDHFKSVNDRFGHQAGDEALRAVGTMLTSHARRTDLIGRWGGEEFVLALPGTFPGDAAAHLERIRQLLASSPVALASGATLALTCSVGIASRPDDGEDAPTLLAVADARLFEAKRGGRNLVVGAPAAAAWPERERRARA